MEHPGAGSHQARVCQEVARGLADSSRSGCVLHCSKGKWYPGEQLPRWALACYWRQDGEPIWRNRDLFGAEDVADDRLSADTAGDASGGSHSGCRSILISAFRAMRMLGPASWRERRLPTNVDPLKSELKDPMERTRLARIFEDGLKEVVGFALPLARR